MCLIHYPHNVNNELLKCSLQRYNEHKVNRYICLNQPNNLVSQNFEVYDFYDLMERKNIMLSFKGELTTELLNSILQVVEGRLKALEELAKVRKRVFNVLVEVMQNLYHYQGESGKENKLASINDGAVIVMIAKNATGYSIFTGNYIENQNVDKLKRRLEEVNSMSKTELKELYKSVLVNGQRSVNGGGGLGMIDIARRSGEKLDFGFVPFDSENSFFSLNVNIA
jgi:hypothetical protein